MKTNFYLQFILTVIAINLTMLSLKEFDVIPTAHAVELNNTMPANTATTDVNIVSVNGQSVFGGNLPITIKDVETNDKLAVEVKGWGTSDLVRVDIKGINTYDKMPVEVKNNYVYVKNY